MKRRIILYLLAAVMLLSFTACKEAETSKEVVSSQNTSDENVSNISEDLVQSEESEEVSEGEEKQIVVSFKGTDDSYENPPHMGEKLFSEKVNAAFEKYNNDELFVLKLRWQWKDPVYAGAFTGFIYKDDSYKEIFGDYALETLMGEDYFKHFLPKFLDFLAENSVHTVNIDDSHDVYILATEGQIKNLQIPDYVGIYVFLHDATEIGHLDGELEYFNYSNEVEESDGQESGASSEDVEKKTIVSYKEKDIYPTHQLPRYDELELLDVVFTSFRQYNDGEYFFLRLSFYANENHDKISGFTYDGKTLGEHYGTKEWSDEADKAFREYCDSLYSEFLKENEIQVIDTESGIYVLATEEQILSLDVPDYFGFFIFLDDAANFGYNESEIEYFDYK